MLKLKLLTLVSFIISCWICTNTVVFGQQYNLTGGSVAPQFVDLGIEVGSDDIALSSMEPDHTNRTSAGRIAAFGAHVNAHENVVHDVSAARKASESHVRTSRK